MPKTNIKIVILSERELNIICNAILDDDAWIMKDHTDAISDENDWCKHCGADVVENKEVAHKPDCAVTLALYYKKIYEL